MEYIPVSVYYYNVLSLLLYLILAAAVIMFLCNIIYMVVFSFISDASADTGLVSITIKRVCAVVGAIAFVLFVFMSILLVFNGCGHHGNSYYCIMGNFRIK